MAVVPCSNKSKGCIYKVASKDMEDHLKVCIFRQVECPLGKVFGTCSWSGNLKELMAHFQERHPQNCHNPTCDFTINNISVSTDCRHLYLLHLNEDLFLLSFKIDTLKEMGYWLVQCVGSKKNAQRHIYEIQVTSEENPKRKVMYLDHCFSDVIDANDVFRQATCAVMPLNLMRNFVVNSKITFRCSIKRTTNEGKPHFAKYDQSKRDISASEPKEGPAGNINRYKRRNYKRAEGPGAVNT